MTLALAPEPVAGEADHAQAADTASYQRMPYPTIIHPITHIDRMATLARIAGLSPPPIETARVLEVGCGSGLNLLAFAAAFPQAQFEGIDIIPEVIAQARDWAAAAGLGNAQFRVANLLDADCVSGEFDYIIAHGVYAWVPAEVAEALLAQIGAHLSPDGVAFVSFNALPGSYARLAVRDAMHHAMRAASGEEEAIGRARAMLAAIGTDKPGDDLLTSGMRYHARRTATRDANVLLHDELGGHFAPAYLGDMLDRAAAHGLAFLTDTRPLQLGDGFLDEEGEGSPQARVVDAARTSDWVDNQLFRAVLLVREGRRTRWTADADAIGRLWVASGAREDAETPGRFGRVGQTVDVGDAGLATALRTVIAAAPRRIAIAALGLDTDQRLALFQLFEMGLVSLHTGSERFALDPGPRPTVSPLVAHMLRAGLPWVATLDHSSLTPIEAACDMLRALDTGDAAALAEAGARAGLDTPTKLAAGVAELAKLAVFVR